MTNDIKDKEHVGIEYREGVLCMKLNRPKKKNAINLAMYSALVDAIKQAEEDPLIRVMLITGTHDCFTSGNDLSDFMDSPVTGPLSPVRQFLSSISQAKKPIIAAVCGYAVGVGTTLLLHCDLVYAGENARFQTPFVRLGLCPEAGSSYLLPKMMGHQRAADLLLSCKSFDAKKAYELGIVNVVCPDEKVFEIALESSQRIATYPPVSVRLAKELMKRGDFNAVRETIELEGRYFRERLSSPEAIEAFRAFLEHREPDFSKFD